MYHTWHKWLAAQLYDNEENVAKCRTNDGNATECIKMQQFLGKLSNSLLSAIPRLISAIPSS